MPASRSICLPVTAIATFRTWARLAYFPSIALYAAIV